jgi:hypothetical protein
MKVPVWKTILVLISIIFVYGEIIGIYHSYTKHSKEDTSKSLYIPTLAWYRSVEIWWHNDKDNIDWTEKLKTDERDCLILFTQYGKGDPGEIAQAVKALKTRITGYPKDKYEQVKNFCKDYITYYAFARDEFDDWVIKFFNGGDIPYKKSNELHSMQNNLYKYDVAELTRSVSRTDSLFVLLHYEYRRMKQRYIKNTPEGKKQFLDVIFKKDNNNLHNLKAAYKDIFDNEIKVNLKY